MATARADFAAITARTTAGAAPKHADHHAVVTGAASQVRTCAETLVHHVSMRRTVLTWLMCLRGCSAVREVQVLTLYYLHTACFSHCQLARDRETYNDVRGHTPANAVSARWPGSASRRTVNRQRPVCAYRRCDGEGAVGPEPKQLGSAHHPQTHGGAGSGGQGPGVPPCHTETPMPSQATDASQGVP